MKHYQRKRPQLPEHTPFLPQSKFSIQTPWHGDSVRTATAPRPSSTENNAEQGSAVATDAADPFPAAVAALGPGGSTLSGGFPLSRSSSSSLSRPSSTLMLHRRAPRLQTGEKYIAPNVSRASTAGLPKLHGMGDLHASNDGSMQSFVGSSAQITLIEDGLIDVEITRKRAASEDVRDTMKLVQVCTPLDV